MSRNFLPECPCGSEEFAQMEFDARGIELGFMCDKCRKEKLSHFRRDVLEDPNYECDEDIEEDRGLEPREWSESLMGEIAREDWARSYDELNGAPENDFDR